MPKLVSDNPQSPAVPETERPGGSEAMKPASRLASATHGPCGRGLSSSEVISLTALISFVAESRGITEKQVETHFHDRFNVPTLTQLTAGQYEDAVTFLVDQVPEGQLTGLGL